MQQIIIYEEDRSLLPFFDLHSICLQLKGYKIKRIYSLAECDPATAPGESGAWALILNLEHRNSCIPLLEELETMSCYVPEENILVAGRNLTDEEITAIHLSGFSFLNKPFRLHEICEWLDTLELTAQQSPAQ